MSRRLATLGLFVASALLIESAAGARPGSELVCHKEVCPVPASSCQVRESERCLHGGGPPRCPAILNVADGTSCTDGNICTTNDSCSAGVCGGSAVVCSSPSDICSPGTGCATPCGPAGCVVQAAGGVSNPTLTVPPGALAAPIALTMTDQTGDPNDPSVFHVYRFGPSGTQFAIPATVDLPAPPLSAGQAPVIEVSDDGVNWTPIATTASAGRVSGPIAHFSSCRTRGVVVATSEELIVVDAVGYQQQVVSMALWPPAGEAGSCTRGSLHGLCFKVKNPSATSTITSNCPVPTPSPAPAGCQQIHIVPWTCLSGNRTLPPFDPTNPGAYEGQHCNRDAGFVIACPDSIYNMDAWLPAGGLAPGQELWINLDLFNAPAPANNVNPLTCLSPSGMFAGFDVLFREPSGSCAPGAKCDWQAGIRSAKLGPFVVVPQGTQLWPSGGTCGSPTGCAVEWEALVNHAPNYPSLKCIRAGALIDCSGAQSTDIVNKNWLLDFAE